MRRLLPLAVAAAVAVVVLTPVMLLADVSSCSLIASSYADTILNPSKGEDTDFFVSSGGVPNLMFLIDTSGSMQNLAPDSTGGWGSFEPTGLTTAGTGYGCINGYANSLVFHSPCGTTTFDGLPFNPSPGQTPPVFAQAKDATGAYCPYMVAGNQPMKTDKPGFDPDFYPGFFDDTKAFKENSWSDTSAGTGSGTLAAFCTGQSGTAKQTSCTACLRDQGYWFDGTYQPNASGRSCGSTAADCAPHNEGVCVKNNQEYRGVKDGTARCLQPNIYLSGNFLNFYPPKFIMARKVIKDVLAQVRRIRMGITVFASDGDGGNLLDALNPPCNQFGSPSNFDSNRGALMNEINNTNKVNFQTTTPLAETLFNIGQYYRSASLPWFDNSYAPNAWNERSGQNKSVCFACQASAVLVVTDGLPNGDSNIPGTDFAANGMTAAVANAPGSYAGMAGFDITGISTTDCPVCETWAELADTAVASGFCGGNQDSGACDHNGNPIVAYLPRVAWYLKNMDFRANNEVGSDGFAFTGKQSLTTYTIGLGTRAAATKILQDTADAGGGLFNGGTGASVTDASSLKAAILRVLDDINTRSTSFGSASLSTLQVTTTQGVLIPRFEPARTAHWDGHLYAFDLYSEFTSGVNSVAGNHTPCTTGHNPSGPANGDYDCDGKCNSVFLVDRDGAFISEDGTGAFRKNSNPDRAACGPSNLCASPDCVYVDSTATGLAKPFWDAGSKLAPIKKITDPTTGIVTESPNTGPDGFQPSLAWNLRHIYTVIDSSSPLGKFTSADPLVDLSSVDPATMVPYLNIRGSRWCSTLSQRLASLGNPAGSTIDSEVSRGDYTTCAKMILFYARGADIFNERASDPLCTYPPSSDAYCTRKYQLGDVFHSSPIEVWPPLASDGFACPRSLHPQCITSLFLPSIPNPSTATPRNGNSYDDYAKSDRYMNRRKFALVGANDGMVHAFQIERTVNGSPNAHMGEEIWAFIPPDLLPKLRLLTESVHQFYVDGTPMVRDVWIDGGALNNVGRNSTGPLSGAGTGTADGIRQGNEFHTVAIIGERRGGTHYTALDITDAGDDLDARPKFMWIYPQPNDPEELQFGETYVEFVPKPPPIGPVKIDHGAPPCTGNYQPYTGTNGARCFEERYVALLSGGFDPQYTRGRGVHMVDLSTGEEIWDFSQPPGTGTGCSDTSDPRCHLNYPIAATVGMMMWGDQTSYAPSINYPYFDTATFGDTGGQMWVLRFAEPGQGWTPGSGNKVTNWYGARTFQSGKTASTPSCGLDYCGPLGTNPSGGGSPFFYISSNVSLALNGLYRVLSGTGDRYNLLDPVGGQCGPDNIRACLQKGCTVTLKNAAGNGPGATFAVETLLGTQTYQMNNPAQCSATPVGEFSFTKTAGSAGGTCGTITQTIGNLVISCPSSLTCSGAAETTIKSATLVCTGDACDPAASNLYGAPIDLKGNPDKLNWFYSMQVFEDNNLRSIFATAAQAVDYDGARLTESDLKNVNPYDTSAIPGNLGSPYDRGWSYYFNHGAGATGTSAIVLDGASYNVWRTDERSASVSAVEQGCGFWNTMQTAMPVGAFDNTDCPVNSPCKAGRNQISYLYGASPGTGGNCLLVYGAYARAQQMQTLVPPYIGKLVAYVAGGQVAFGLTSVRVPQGGANVTLGGVQDLASQVEWLPVDMDMHRCRHAPKRDPITGVLLTGPPASNCK
jgi:type IV pilus assembly protein PilY1